MTGTPHSKPNGFSFTDLMIFRRTWWQHLIFWAVAFAILLSIFKTSSSFEKIDVIYTFIFLVPIAAIVYLNLYLSIPRFLKKEMYLLYILFFILFTGGGALFLYFLFNNLIDFILPEFYFISYYNVPTLLLFTGSFMLLTTLLKLSRSWFMLLRVERITASHQLKSLQSQINPHFLLNSLQTIYALSLEKSERSPEVILQLSEILKYTLYETGQPKVKLEKEIKMIRDYVEIYRHRVDPGRVDIRLEVSGEVGDLVIAPMLVIPFIENSFKHGLQGSPGEVYVHIHIRIDHTRFRFQIMNNLGETDHVKPEKKGGIGINNTEQRLKLIYPEKHALTFGENNEAFMVKLELDLTD